MPDTQSFVFIAASAIMVLGYALIISEKVNPALPGAGTDLALPGIAQLCLRLFFL